MLASCCEICPCLPKVAPKIFGCCLTPSIKIPFSPSTILHNLPIVFATLTKSEPRILTLFYSSRNSSIWTDVSYSFSFFVSSANSASNYFFLHVCFPFLVVNSHRLDCVSWKTLISAKFCASLISILLQPRISKNSSHLAPATSNINNDQQPFVHCLIVGLLLL